uniref:Protein kinase domain-containing protein n=1 Tax=Nelumbo nucifera TaxID=4432 RepID=A0A822XJE9_NELNU|nr:TPA_asm: hypothetical protein HUJ06_021286 [Nelumbo nucifera]
MDQQDEDPRQNHQYPLDHSSYKILAMIEAGVSAIVYKAECLSNSSAVAIKAIDLDRSKANFDDIRREANTMSLHSHPNILRAHCSFTVDRHLWVVMPFMSGGSLQSIISSSFPDGLPEPCIAIVLRETLNALMYLHDQGRVHRDIKAGNILVASDGSIKLADFGVSASIYEPSPSSMKFNGVAGIPYWMAPEVIYSHTGYSFKADIWTFGITALELSHGRPPLSHLPPSKSLVMKFATKFQDYRKNTKDKSKFSKNFKEMVKDCLNQDSSKRPTAEMLLKHPFFKNCGTPDFLTKNLLQGLPTVEERLKKIIVDHPPPVCSTDVNVHEDDSDEASLDYSVKNRRISGWNFNEGVLELDPIFPTDKEESSSQTQTTEDDQDFIAAADSSKIIRNTIDVDQQDQVTKEQDRAEPGMRGIVDLGGAKINIDQIQIDGGVDPTVLQEGTPNQLATWSATVSTLEDLRQSLDSEQDMVMSLIGRIHGAELGLRTISPEECCMMTINGLRRELERVKKRVSILEQQLERLTIIFPASPSSNNDNNGGNDDDESNANPSQ